MSKTYSQIACMIRASQIARSLWKKACQFDGIPVDSKFIILSENNPYDRPLNRAVSLKHGNVLI